MGKSVRKNKRILCRIIAVAFLVGILSPLLLPVIPAYGAYSDAIRYSYWTTGAGYHISDIERAYYAAGISSLDGYIIKNLSQFYATDPEFDNSSGYNTNYLANKLVQHTYLVGTDASGNTWYFEASGSNAFYVHPKVYGGNDADSSDVRNITSLIFPSTITCGGKSYTVKSIGGCGSGYVSGYYDRVQQIWTGGGINLSSSIIKSYDYHTFPQGKWSYSQDNGNSSFTRYMSAGGCRGIVGNGDIFSAGYNMPSDGMSSNYYEQTHYVYNTTLKTVTIPATVTEICSYAFAYCQALTNVYGCEGLVAIGSGAFTATPSLSVNSVYTSNNYGYVMQIQYRYNGAYCAGSVTGVMTDCVTSVKLPPQLIIPWSSMKDFETVGYQAFVNRTNLPGPVLPDTTKSIGSYAFSGTKITMIGMGKSLTGIGERAFEGCLFSKVMFPETMQVIGEAAFEDCSGITTVAIPESVVSIGKDAFKDCPLVSVTIHSDTAYIGEDSYEGYTTLGGRNGAKVMLFTPVGSTSSAYAQKYSDHYVDMSNYQVRFEPNFPGLEAKTEFGQENMDKKYILVLRSDLFAASGKVFVNWNTEADGTGTAYEAGTEIIITSPLTLYAQWRNLAYTVTLDPNKGSVSQTTFQVTEGSMDNATGVPVPTRMGYLFDGWYTSPVGGTRVYDSSGNTVKDGTFFNSAAQWIYEGNITLYAQWISESYTVSFEADSGATTCSPVTVYYQKAYGTLPIPEKTGYVFLGWSYNGKIITSVSPVSVAGNHTLTANWKAAGPSSKGIFYDSVYGELPAPTRLGYTFNGWYLSEDASGNGAGAVIMAGSTVKTAENHYVHARWMPNRYTVNFDSMGGTDCSPITVEYDRAYGYLTKLPVPIKSSYTFTGWYVSDDGTNGVGSIIANGTRVTILEEQTLYAGWKLGTPNGGGSTEEEQAPLKLIIGFNAKGGSVTPEEKEVTYPGIYGTLPIPVRTGYTFLQWTLDNSPVSASTVLKYSYGHSLDAEWKADTFTIALDGRGATKQTQTNVTVTYEVQLPDVAVPEKTGYSFLGYFTATTAQGGGKQYYNAYGKSIDQWKETKVDVLYAHWKQNDVILPEEDRYVPPVPDYEQTKEIMIRNDALDDILVYADDYDVSTGALTDLQPYLAYNIYQYDTLVSQGAIPSTEEIAIRAKTGAYMLDYTLHYNTGMEYVKVLVKVPYRTQYENKDETLVISEIQYATMEHMVPKEWAYWEVIDGGIYYPDRIEVENASFAEGSVTIPVEWDGEGSVTKPFYKKTAYGEPAGHLIWSGSIASDGTYERNITLEEEQYIISAIVGEAPDVVSHLKVVTKNAAWADTIQFMVRNDRLQIGDKLILDDTAGEVRGAAYIPVDTDELKEDIPTLAYTQIYKSGIELEEKAQNGEYPTETTLYYVADKSNVGNGRYEHVLQRVNEISIHTPVACNGSIEIDGNNKEQLELKNDLNYFTIFLDNRGLHVEQLGYGERDYTFAYSGKTNLAAEKGVLLNQVRFTFDVFLDRSNEAIHEKEVYSDAFIPSMTWINIGKDKQSFYIPVTQKNGWYDVELRSIAVNCPEQEEEKRLLLQQKFVNTDKSKYIATDSFKIAVRSYLEDIFIVDTEDSTAKKELDEGKQALVLKKGYGFFYRILSRGEFFNQEAGITVKPSYYWSSLDGTVRKKAYLYVREPEIKQPQRSFRELKSAVILEGSDVILQQWDGYFYMPEQIYCVTEENRDIFLKYAEEQTFTGKEDFFEQEGYLIVSFEIDGKSNQGEEYFFSAWEETAIANDIKEKGWKYCNGDVIRYDLSKGISDDYEAGNLE